MSRGPQVTQAEFDYLKVLQKRKVGAIEAAVQTGRNVDTVRSIYRVETLKQYQDHNRRERKPRQQALPIKVQDQPERDKVRSLAEMQQAVQNLSDLYWQLSARLDGLNKQLREKKRFWES